MSELSVLPEPQRVFYHFDQISRIPRPSGQEKAVGDYLLSFAAEHKLECSRDASGNVIIIKEASAGREKDEPLILQGHMDMVCEKESACTKDMEKEGLDLVLDGDWLYAEGTTLGGDDGIAVAMALALLEDDTLSHPRLEFVCTTEEETGMGGAHGLDPAPLKGRLLLNIDSEEEGILTAGCAGGENLVLQKSLRRESADGAVLSLTLSGLTGGHSGSCIQCGRANADVLMNRILRRVIGSCRIRLVSLEGGTKHNAIPREASAVVVTDDPAAVRETALQMEAILKEEFAVTDPELKLTITECPDTPEALTEADTCSLLALLSSLPDGVMHMDQHLEGLVETSLNLGILRVSEGELYAEYLVRSSLESRLDEMFELFTFTAEQAGASLTCADRYPAWQYVADSAFREKLIRLYEEQYGKKPVVETIHAGLECGLLSEKIPGLDAVSIGPDIEDIHTPQERMSVSSVQRTYTYVRSIVEAR